MSDIDGPRVDTQIGGYNLRSKRRGEHVSPTAGRVSRSPVRDGVNNDPRCRN